MQAKVLFEDDQVLVQRNLAGCIVIFNKTRGAGGVRVTPKDGKLYASPEGAGGVRMQVVTFMGMPAMIVP